MGRVKTLIAVGFQHLERTGADAALWSQRMMDEFGRFIEPQLPEIRQWALVLHNIAQGPRSDRKNCWEFTACGREKGGKHASRKGACPASTETRLHTIHGGVNAGRACWTIDGTLCRGGAPDSRAEKKMACSSCSFYHALLQEEHPHLIVSDRVLLSLLP
jgi:hypothetical protein